MKLIRRAGLIAVLLLATACTARGASDTAEASTLQAEAYRPQTVPGAAANCIFVEGRAVRSFDTAFPRQSDVAVQFNQQTYGGGLVIVDEATKHCSPVTANTVRPTIRRLQGGQVQAGFFADFAATDEDGMTPVYFLMEVEPPSPGVRAFVGLALYMGANPPPEETSTPMPRTST